MFRKKEVKALHQKLNETTKKLESIEKQNIICRDVFHQILNPDYDKAEQKWAALGGMNTAHDFMGNQVKVESLILQEDYPSGKFSFSLEIPGDHLLTCLVDTVGKGTPSAMIGSYLKGLLEFMVPQTSWSTPEGYLKKLAVELNDKLIPAMSIGRFIAINFILIPKGSSFFYTLFMGSQSLFILNEKKKAVELKLPDHPALGIFPSFMIEENIQVQSYDLSNISSLLILNDAFCELDEWGEPQKYLIRDQLLNSVLKREKSSFNLPETDSDSARKIILDYSSFDSSHNIVDLLLAGLLAIQTVDGDPEDFEKRKFEIPEGLKDLFINILSNDYPQISEWEESQETENLLIARKKVINQRTLTAPALIYLSFSSQGEMKHIVDNTMDELIEIDGSDADDLDDVEELEVIEDSEDQKKDDELEEAEELEELE